MQILKTCTNSLSIYGICSISPPFLGLKSNSNSKSEQIEIVQKLKQKLKLCNRKKMRAK